ncbi:DNA-binding protein [Conservatibacter flavescens]|uniref:Transcriptional regulator n=1 Tax=Conservatibacter flavescens TaxID=28161 RepID=A0A2M8S4X9_9PAST|nr:DNA-binding protein [Conservatibacter flavescens]PJG86183.1 transcriptional regulator [Conservatibacter flavescens]
MNSYQNKEWFSAFELIGKGELPNQATNITRKATKENWLKRQIKGKKGVAFEYHYSSLPESVQNALGFITKPTELPTDRVIKTALPLNLAQKERDCVEVSKMRLLTAIETLEEILEITHKTMKPKAKAQMVWMIYELLNEESANEKIVDMIKLVA